MRPSSVETSEPAWTKRNTLSMNTSFHADKRHLHHRLLEIGHGHRQAVLILYAWTAVIAGAGLAISFAPIFTLPFAAADVAILLCTVLPRIARRGIG